jgi:hypothetical protein
VVLGVPVGRDKGAFRWRQRIGHRSPKRLYSP